MANEKISMAYNLRQNSSENSRVYGLWFPQPVRRDTLNLRGLSDHIASHGTVYTRDVILGVLTKFASCITELVSEGVGVKIDGLGTFYPTFEASGADNAVGYNIEEHLEGIHIRFWPENAQLDKITSRAFAQKCKLRQNLIFDMYGVPKKVVNGELVNYGSGDDDEQEP